MVPLCLVFSAGSIALRLFTWALKHSPMHTVRGGAVLLTVIIISSAFNRMFIQTHAHKHTLNSLIL